MSDTVTVTTTESWGSRLGGSLKGMLIGLALFAGGFPLLFWNEGNAVRTRKALEEGEGVCVSVESCSAVDPALEGKLVHMTGLADTQDILDDGIFGIRERAIRLERNVEMYQWIEESHTSEKKKMGGSVERTTTYTYSKGWKDALRDSSRFHQPAGHENPASIPYPSDSLESANVSFGAFRLTQDQIKRIGDSLVYTFPTNYVCPIESAEVSGGYLYVPSGSGTAAQSLSVSNLVSAVVKRSVPANPHVGDVRVSFRVVRPHEISIVYKQHGDTFVKYTAKNGKSVALLKDGVHDAAEMFAAAQSANSMMCWFLRLVGFLMMFFGVSTFLKPLSVLADVLPILGDIVGVIAGIGAFAAAAACSLVTIAVAWFFYRPFVAAILVAAAIGIVILKRKAKAAVAAKAAEPSGTKA